MPRITLKGLAWRHRRATEPLAHASREFTAQNPDLTVEWSVQPLSGFEFAPVGELAKAYDFLVLDHPFCGEIVAQGSLLPVDELTAGLQDSFVGPSLASYQYGGKTWALPIDAATHVQAVRPDLLERLGAGPPRNWSDLMELGRQARRNGLWLAAALHGVHSLVTFFTLMANLRKPCTDEAHGQFCDPEAAGEALDLMRQLMALSPPEVLDWNSIRVHDEMVARDDLVSCPAVCCYATYAEADQRRPLRFHDVPGPRGNGGSTLGGTGLGISARCNHPEAAMAFARYLAGAGTQIGFTRHHGQPARIEAWKDDGANGIFGNCFRDTLIAYETAWVRPRYNGYMRFQREAGDLIEAHLRGVDKDAELVRKLQALHEACSINA